MQLRIVMDQHLVQPIDHKNVTARCPYIANQSSQMFDEVCQREARALVLPLHDELRDLRQLGLELLCSRCQYESFEVLRRQESKLLKRPNGLVESRILADDHLLVALKRSEKSQKQEPRPCALVGNVVVAFRQNLLAEGLVRKVVQVRHRDEELGISIGKQPSALADRRLPGAFVTKEQESFPPKRFFGQVPMVEVAIEQKSRSANALLLGARIAKVYIQEVHRRSSAQQSPSAEGMSDPLGVPYRSQVAIRL